MVVFYLAKSLLSFGTDLAIKMTWKPRRKYLKMKYKGLRSICFVFGLLWIVTKKTN